MAEESIDTSHFSPDTVDFIRLLYSHGVQYVIAESEAVIQYRYVRLTGDVDFFYNPSAENVGRLYRVFLDFWDGNVPGIASPDELSAPSLILQYGLPPNQIDLLNDISGVSFDRAWNGRNTANLQMDGSSIPVHYIGLSELIVNKKASGRPKDLDDLRYLEQIKG